MLFVAQAGAARPLAPDSAAVGGVQAVAADGSWRWLTRDPIAPNDLCFGPDGLLYVTDPTRRPSRDDGRIWRCDPKTGEVELLASLDWYPNGIGFGVEEDWLYVASTGDSRMVRMPLQGDRLGPAEVVFEMGVGHPDGFAFDCDGNLVLGAVTLDGSPGTIQVWSPRGELLDTFQPTPTGRYTNVALAADGTLVTTDVDGEAVHVLPGWGNPGLPLHPFRDPMV
jgi:gluconolactonase